MPDGNAFSLHRVLPIRQDTQQQVCYALVQQVDLIYVQDAPVSLGQ